MSTKAIQITIGVSVGLIVVFAAFKSFWLAKWLGRAKSEKATDGVSSMHSSLFEIKRYLGLWTQAYALPNAFQDHVNAVNTTAEYSLVPGYKDTLRVTNTETRADGSKTLASGYAWINDANVSTTRLRVSFFMPFSGQYWILNAGGDDPEQPYTYAMVGTPDLDHLWILTRNMEGIVDQPVLDALLGQARDMGYDISALV